MAELVVAEGLTKTYGEGAAATHALLDVSFTLHSDEFASVVGRSGSGKSTLLDLVGLLDTPTSGRLVINGVDTSGVSDKERAQLRNTFLGFIFQFHHLLPEFSVLENVLMPALIASENRTADLERRARETLEVLDLGDIATKNANDISGGQKQRVAIARAMMNRPDLILADEPTGNLDSETSELVYQLFRKLHREWGTGFLIVTHDMSIAGKTDRVLEILDGRLVADVPARTDGHERYKPR